MDRYELVGKLVEQYEQGVLDADSFRERVREVWHQLETSSDPAEQLLHEILAKTDDLVKGRLTPAMYEHFIKTVRSDWLNVG